jgi:NitT/TauT family transport system permease protein
MTMSSTVPAERDRAVDVDLAPAPAPGSGRRRRWLRIGGPVVVFAAFIGVWYLFSYVVLAPEKRFLVPPPHEVVDEALLDWKALRPNLEALWLSTRVALIGFVIASVLGIAIGVVMSLAEWIEWSLWPYAIALQCIPILALTPLIGGLLGFGFNARVVVTVMFALFPIISNTLFGILSVDTSFHELFSLAGASRLTRLRKLQLPSALPSIFAGLRIAAGLSVIGAVVGDTFFRQGEAGIGALIDIYRLRLQGTQMIGCILLAALLGLVVFVTVSAVGRQWTKAWYEPRRGA